MHDPVGTAMSPSDQAPEWRLLCASARSTLRPTDVERIAGICQQPLDWPLFLSLVARHRVAPLVWQSLKGIGETSIPDQARNELGLRVKRNALKALNQTAELVQLSRRFEEADVRVLPLKGPALAMQAYGALNLRHAGDLDLLVDPGAVWDADRILNEAGYLRTVPEYPLSPGQAAAFMKIRKDFSYTHPESSVGVELHWRWSQNAYLLPLEIDELWTRRDSVRLGSDRVAALPRQELVLYLCAHGAHTGWFRLKWLCDVAELIGDDSRTEIPELMARAKDLGVKRMLAQGLALRQQILDVPLPPDFAATMGRDRIVRSLAQTANQSLTQDERYWSTDNTPVSWMPAQFRYRLKLRANLRYKWHNFYFHSLWTEECRRIRLPAWLFPLYFVLALFPWLGSLFRRQQPVAKNP